MPMKTSAVGCWFVAILFLMAGRGTMGFAQDAAAPAAEDSAAVASESPVAAEPADAPAPAIAAPVDAGLAKLNALRAASAAAEEEAAAQAPASVAAPAPRPTPEERRAQLAGADLAALRAAEEDCLQAAQEISTYVPELHRQMRQAYEDARQNDPAIQDLNRQIADLEARREQLLANHPAVLEKRRAIDQAQQDMLAELHLRTELEGRIAAQETGAADSAE